MFNDYIWQTYLNAGGKNVVSFFKQNLTDNLSQDYIDTIERFRLSYCPEKVIIEETSQQLRDLSKDLNDNLSLLESGEYTIESALQFLYNGIKGEGNYSAQDVFACFSDSIDYFTTSLAVEIPDLFTPYYFKYNFNVLEKIAQEFDIELPPIPIKKDYEGRFHFYGDICGAFLGFRERYNMSPYELCAFLYDFAPKYIGGTDSYIIKDLPDPKSAFFIGGSKNDKFLANDTDTITCWQCNPDTRAGDMIVMYLRTPVSAVDSVWRSVSIGFNDPFFYYYRCTYIAHPVFIEPISQKQLQKDKVFKYVPIVRKNMQGVNGVELMPSEYNHLMDLAKADVPRLEFVVTDGNQDFVNEKDVENKLIKPLIAKLGYSEEEYVQQLYIEIGNRNHALIPDFALLPITTRGHQSAFALIEVKHSIPNQKEMEEVRIQARSYARQLRVNYSVIASKDKIWVYVPDDDFTEEVFSASWGELNDANTFSHLLKLISKRTDKQTLC